jgi:hypothetical protein
MMFELDIPTKAKITDVVVLSQKNRQVDEDPGVKLTFELTLANDALSMFDGHLKAMLFTKNGAISPRAQAELDGVTPASDLPNLTTIGKECGTIKWGHPLSGYQLAIHLGLGDNKSDIESDGCELSGVRITPSEGGTIRVKLNVEAPNVSERAFGKLAKLKSRDVELALFAPQADMHNPSTP